MKQLLIVDNNDSFTYNLVEVIRQNKRCNIEVCMLEDIEQLKLSDYDGIILSPGPGLPAERLLLKPVIAKIIEYKLPLLGVCLGHQAIVEYFGGEIEQLNRIIHGESSDILISSCDLFTGLPQRIKVGRYHSWVAKINTFPKVLQVTAKTDDGLIMAFRHFELNICGVQFHPESVLTPTGKEILSNWLTFCVAI